MTALVIGSTGMLGHQLVAAFRSTGPVFTASRRGEENGGGAGSIAVDLRRPDPLLALVEAGRFGLVVNAAGIIKQRSADAEEMWEVNARFPHRLAAACRRSGTRLIHLSTDCVFSGRRGRYCEQDVPDPVDDYGRSKLEGEPDSPGTMVVRTSMIGLERTGGHSLIEWFLSQPGPVQGYTGAIFSGLTTRALSRLIRDHCAGDGFRDGLWHVSADPISKFDLLSRLNALLGRRPSLVRRKDDFHCDRSLDYGRYAGSTGYRPPDWDAMLAELADDISGRGSRSLS